MLDTALLAISIAVFIYVCYRILKAYKPSWFQGSRRIDTFVSSPPQGPPVASKVNTPIQPIPAAAPPIRQEEPQEPRVVASAGPNSPNAAAPPTAKISPDVAPIDPYDDKNMEAPIHDSMRHPELSFGPGVDNNKLTRDTSAGVASDRGLTAESPFSPEFAQNGGIFMGAVTANDLTKDDRYASI